MPHLDENGKWIPTPDFKGSELAKHKYMEREVDRWINGFKNTQGEVVMEGLMYFYLCLGCLKDGQGNIFRPKWRDGDMYVLGHYLKARESNKNLLIVKRREFGLTSMFAGAIPIYNAIVHPRTVSILTSASDDRLEDIRSNKINPWKESLVEMGLLPSNNLSDGRRFKFSARDNPSEVASEIRFMDTNKDDKAATNMESQRAFYIFLDEYFLHNRAELVLMSAQASMRKGANQIGTMVLGGSCNNINKHSIPRLRTLLDKLDAYNLDFCFVKATWNYEPYEDENGFSIHDKAKEAILKERDGLRKQKAWDKLDNTIKSYPLSMKDLTSSEGANVISGEITSVLQKSRELCMSMDENNYRCSLVSTHTGIFPDANKDGHFFIFNHPQPGHEYIAGMDPIPFTIGASEKGSDMVCAIKDRTTNQYVAYMSLRTKDSEYAFAEWEKFLVYYKSVRFPLSAPCNVERNMGQVIMRLAIVKNKEYLLAVMPDQKEPGYSKNEKTASILFSCMVNYLKYCGTICIPRFLNDMDKFPVVKSDLIDSIQGCELYDSFRNTNDTDETHKEIKKVIRRDEQGRTYAEWVTV